MVIKISDLALEPIDVRIQAFVVEYTLHLKPVRHIDLGGPGSFSMNFKGITPFGVSELSPTGSN